MYKLGSLLCALLSLLCGVALGGFIAAPLAHGPALALAPYHGPIASSYSNTVRVVHGSVPIVRPVAIHQVAHSPVVAIAHEPAIAIAHEPAIAIAHDFH